MGSNGFCWRRLSVAKLGCTGLVNFKGCLTSFEMTGALESFLATTLAREACVSDCASRFIPDGVPLMARALRTNSGVNALTALRHLCNAGETALETPPPERTPGMSRRGGSTTLGELETSAETKTF